MKDDIKTAIEDFLRSNSYSANQIAKEAGVAPNIIYNILSGKRKYMYNVTEAKIRKAMNKLSINV